MSVEVLAIDRGTEKERKEERERERERERDGARSTKVIAVASSCVPSTKPIKDDRGEGSISIYRPFADSRGRNDDDYDDAFPATFPRLRHLDAAPS